MGWDWIGFKDYQGASSMADADMITFIWGKPINVKTDMKIGIAIQVKILL